MSTLERPRASVLPPLVAGQRLHQPTFPERYEAMPPRRGRNSSEEVQPTTEIHMNSHVVSCTLPTFWRRLTHCLGASCPGE
jgi:hypothetical protein